MFFIAALAVAGFVSANTTEEIKKEVNAESSKERTVLVENKDQKGASQTLKVTFEEHDWVTIVTPCGAVFYLDYNDYSTSDEFWNDVHHFAGIKCS
ncbi:hypothetical protein [Chryseobacterium daeguense]|uniref:hypothetical protein n=1 Tax=Chryseobacterium daeguense TaxID=412438 RepID=UPI000417817A|nr:hypothetical protein [Chryseobacterium daeguense]